MQPSFRPDGGLEEPIITVIVIVCVCVCVSAFGLKA